MLTAVSAPRNQIPAIWVATGLNQIWDVHDRIDPYWIDFTLVFVPTAGKWRWRMWADHGVEFFIHPAMQAPGQRFFGVFSA